VFANSGFVVSIGLFFSLMIAGLVRVAALGPSIQASYPMACRRCATQVSHLPPVSSLFAALLGYNPMASLSPAVSPARAAAWPGGILTGKDFFPELISGPFQQGLTIVFAAAATMAVVAAGRLCPAGRPLRPRGDPGHTGRGDAVARRTRAAAAGR